MIAGSPAEQLERKGLGSHKPLMPRTLEGAYPNHSRRQAHRQTGSATAQCQSEEWREGACHCCLVSQPHSAPGPEVLSGQEAAAGWADCSPQSLVS
jgi:hypothetical protein